MKYWSILYLVLLLFVGCGYKVGWVRPEILKGKEKVCVGYVNNPTTMLELNDLIRDSLRYELTRRLGLKWSLCDKADVVFLVDVHSFSGYTKVESEKERTLKSEVEIIVSVKIKDRRTKKIIWESGKLSARESYLGEDREGAEKQAVKDVVENVVDMLAKEF